MLKLTQLDGQEIWVAAIQKLRRPRAWEIPRGVDAGAWVDGMVVKETPEQILKDLRSEDKLLMRLLSRA